MSDLSPGRRTLGFLLREGSRLMRRRFVYHSKRAGLGLNPSEASLLLQVFHDPGIKQIGVAIMLDMEAISIVRLVDSLEEAGLVQRRPHATDRRARTLWLTEAGEAAVAKIRAITEIVRAEALAGIPPADREHLLDTLLALRGNLLRSGESEESAAA
ncbi:MAG TPA: MarR family transcriptional regulator [Acetobacteraceae bacterium]|jgi:MarR family transcriptional regulator, transcriptional regulator for hemolysin|nr:MarR family transcriptional regulator [Acetobacteraceae bacterium]